MNKSGLFSQTRFLSFLYLVPVLLMVVVWLALTVNVPFWDDFDAILAYLNQPFSERLSHVFDFHNEHRIFTARLVFESIYAILGHFDFRVCMGVGMAMLLLYAFLLRGFFRCELRCVSPFFVPCFWLLTSFLNYENLCWAMTSVSNNQVLLWALLAVFAYERRRFLPMILCAFLATFSTGGGLPLWVALMIAEILDQRQSGFSLKRMLYILVPAIVAVALYLHGFPSSTGEFSPSWPSALWRVPLFFVIFVGNVVPFVYTAIPIGIVIVVFSALVAFNFRKLSDRRPAVFGLYLMGMVAAASLSRSGQLGCARSFRYVIVSVSICTCLLACLLQLYGGRISPRFRKVLLCVLTSGAILYSIVFLTGGGFLFHDRNKSLRHNILAWPECMEGLRYVPTQLKRADEIMRESVKRGIYNPATLLAPGERRPSSTVPWLSR